MDVPPTAYDSGSINGKTFLITTWLFFGLAAIAFVGRIGIHIQQRKKFALDDLFFLLAFASLLTTVVIIQLQVYDGIFLTIAVQHGVVPISPDTIQIYFQTSKYILVSGMIAWITTCAVKFSFLFFFKQLLEQMRGLFIYWCIVLLINVGTLGYGLYIYYVHCPWFFQDKAFTCPLINSKHPSFMRTLVAVWLDIFTDILILIIPIIIVWKIRASLLQKLALGSSLCLTVFVVVVGIVRAINAQKGQLDLIECLYWHILVTEVAVLMAACFAFRSFFVARAKRKSNVVERTADRRFFSESFLQRFRRGRCPRDLGDAVLEDEGVLPGIPGACMTGMRSFIDGQGRSVDVDVGGTAGEDEGNADAVDTYPSYGEDPV